MPQEADYYTAHEAARLLGISPARVRQMLRAGELQGERGPELPEGVPGPWRVPAGAVDTHGQAREALDAPDAPDAPHAPDAPDAPDAAESVAPPHQPHQPHQHRAPSAPGDAPGSSSLGGGRPSKEEAPSDTSERLSEGVGALRDKMGEILKELDLLESRLEAAEIEHLAVREAASREKGRADGLQRALDARRVQRREERPGSPGRVPE